jgi:hypothetical protein
MDGDKENGVVVFASKKRAQQPRQKKMIHPAHTAPLRSWRRRIIAICLVAVLCIAFGLYRYVTDHTGPQNQCNGRANSPLYTRAAKVMNPGAKIALGGVVADMKDMKNFKHDPTCLYVATVYSLRVDDARSARQYYNNLSKVYDAKKPNILQLGPEPTKSLEQLNFEIGQMENQSSNELKNFQRFNAEGGQ